MTEISAATAGRPDVLAIAESDSYLKWAAWLLQPTPWDVELAILDSDIAPSSRQRDDAVSSTRFEHAVGDYDIRALRSRLRRRPPAVLVLACTGPTIAILTSFALPRSASSTVVVAGLPGIGLPVRERAIRARRGVDVFVAHSIREQDEYRAAFDRHANDSSPPTAVALASLPFVTRGPRPDTGNTVVDRRVVFAPQPSVPSSVAERRALLRRLAAIGPPAPIVKARSRNAEAVTHREPNPYDEIWNQMVAQDVSTSNALVFSDENLRDALDRASCLVTVSSTAAIEAIGRSCPVLIIDDFGVNDELLNGVFANSGLTGPLERATVAAPRSPAPEWLEHNYFHDPDRNDWTEVVTDHLSRLPRQRRRVAWRTLASRPVAAKSMRLIAQALRRHP